jgi:hypothetical protein
MAPSGLSDNNNRSITEPSRVSTSHQLLLWIAVPWDYAQQKHSNEVIAKKTRFRVRETMPDGIFDQADDVEVVQAPAIGSIRLGSLFLTVPRASSPHHHARRASPDAVLPPPYKLSIISAVPRR